MAKIIFFTDLHFGGNYQSRDGSRFDIHGKDWSLPLLKALISYGKKTPGTIFIHGGDEVHYLQPSNRDTRQSPQEIKKQTHKKYLANARTISNEILYSHVSFARAIGNHDPIGNLDRMGFNRLSHIFSQSALPHTGAIVCQPQLDFSGEKTRFFYDPDHVISLIDEVEAPNLVLTAHWDFKHRKKLIPGGNYLYENNTAIIRNYLEQKVRDGKLHSVFTLHGHSHNFRFNQSGLIDMLTMPSISQSHLSIPEFPCGIFAELEENKETGEVEVTFKRIIPTDSEGKNYVVQTVKKGELVQYSRCELNG